MRNKGAIWTLAIALALVCIYQLSFTWKAAQVRKDAKEFANNDAVKEQYYLDSISSEDVYNFLGFKKYTFREVQEREINLGLDLQGGMNVVLEVSVEDVIRSLSNNNRDTTFNRAIALAKRMQLQENTDFVTLFGRAYSTIDPNARMAAVFNTVELKDRIEYNSTNQEVLDVIREETESAIKNSFNIITTRIDHFGVVQPNVQRIEGGERILVELPGVDEKARVRRLLQGTAKLEFWETYDNTELYENLLQGNEVIKQYLGTQKGSAPAGEKITEENTGAVTQPDTTTEPSLLKQLQESEAADTAEQAIFNEYPLFAVLAPYATQDRIIPGSTIGRAHFKDTSRVNTYMRILMQRNVFPKNFRYMWSALPVEDPETKKPTDIYELHAIRVTTRDGQAPLDGSVVTSAREGFDQYQGTSHVSMTMDGEGTKVWGRITTDNVGKNVIVAMDNLVYSDAVVREPITTGSTEISGNFSVKDAQDLANLLKSGTLPARCDIIQEEIIGPSLGKESIKSGINSLLISFILIFVFMIFYYGRRAGFIADLVLFLNMFFLIGVLSSLGLALTLPGIAGIVLTIGMSVDANVLIYERVREEVMAGKGTRLAISDGFKNALSAIIDGNITTLVTGIILFVLGTGPVKGFATTLVIGICTTLFSALLINRLVFEIYLRKNSAIAFSTKLTEGAFKNINIDYIKNRKFFYALSGLMIVIGIVSLFTKGLDEGVDFSGGRNYVVKFEKPVDNLEIAGMLENTLETRPTVITFGTSDRVRVTTKYGIESNDPEMSEKIQELLYQGLKPVIGSDVTYENFSNNYIQSIQLVGPTMADDIKRQSLVALGIALLFIFGYIAVRFRNWRFGIGAISSLLHDAFFVVVLFSLFYGLLPFSMEIDQTFIAAILTIVGYSVNDTVVIFDRIREYRHLHPKMPFKILLNKAVNDTFSRTIVTSLTVLITVAIIFFYTGESVMGFAFAMFVGLISGIYSTIFIATALVYETQPKAVKEAK